MRQEKKLWTLWHYIIDADALKEQFTQKLKFCDYLLTTSQLESQLKFHGPQNIPGASQQNSVDASLFEKVKTIQRSQTDLRRCYFHAS